MKHLNLLGILGLIFLLIVQSSCSKDDEFTFKFDEKGECYYPSVQAISIENFEKSVVGSGWEHVSTHEIDAVGEYLKGEYYADLVGASPQQYFFESSSTMKSYYYADAYPARGFSTSVYSYMENVNRIIVNANTRLQILSVDKDILKVLEHLAVRAGGQKIYGYSTYKRMSAQELKECQKNYPTDLSNPRDLVLSVEEGPIFISGKSYSFDILDGNGNIEAKASGDDICSVSLKGNQVKVDLLKNGATVYITDRLRHKSVWIFSIDESLEPTGHEIYDCEINTLIFNKDKKLFTADGREVLSYESFSLPIKAKEGITSLAEWSPMRAVVVDADRKARHIIWDRFGYIHDIIPMSLVEDLITKNDGFSTVYKVELVNCYGLVFQILPLKVVYKKEFKSGDKL